MLPGPLPVNAMLHKPPAARAAPQLLAWVNPPVTAICTPVANAEPRLRSVRLGESSTESASAAVAADAVAGIVSLARYAAAPGQILPLQADTGRTALRTVDGNAVVGASFNGKSKVSAANRLWLADGAKLPPNSALPLASIATLDNKTGALALPGFETDRPPKRAVWSTTLAALTRTAKLLPIADSGVSGRSGRPRLPTTHAVPDAPAAAYDCVPGASTVDPSTELPSSDMRNSTW
jgi:hypothetical protein